MPRWIKQGRPVPLSGEERPPAGEQPPSEEHSRVRERPVTAGYPIESGASSMIEAGGTDAIKTKEQANDAVQRLLNRTGGNRRAK